MHLMIWVCILSAFRNQIIHHRIWICCLWVVRFWVAVCWQSMKQMIYDKSALKHIEYFVFSLRFWRCRAWYLRRWELQGNCPGTNFGGWFFSFAAYMCSCRGAYVGNLLNKKCVETGQVWSNLNVVGVLFGDVGGCGLWFWRLSETPRVARGSFPGRKCARV